MFLKTALKTGYAMDAVRLWPRVFVVAYALELYRILEWYMALPKPDVDQSTFVGLATGLCAPILKWYMENGIDWNGRPAEPTS